MHEQPLDSHPYVVLRPSQRAKLIRYTKWMWIAFTVYTLVLVTGVLNPIDEHFVLGLWHSHPRINEIARITEKPGLRSLVYPTTLAAGLWLAIRRHDMHPPITAVWALIGTNAATGILKLLTFRPTPRQAGPEFFNTDWLGLGAFPSGHTANLGCAAALGIMAMFASRVRWRYLFSGLLMVLCVVVAVSSWARDTHWVSDLIVGYLLGAAVAMTTSLFTADLPVHWRHPNYIGSTRLLVFAGLGITAGSFLIFAENSFLSHSNTSILIMLGLAYVTLRHRYLRRKSISSKAS